VTGHNNIDVFVNELGYEIAHNLKDGDLNFIDKALGVLVNDGVYAYYVFFKAREKKNDEDKNKVKKVFIDNLLIKIKNNDHLREYFWDKNKSNRQNEDVNFFRNLSSDLHKLLFFRDLLERALVYARYHAKALSGDSNE